MSPDAHARFLRAHQAYGQGNFQEAISELQSIVGRPESSFELENLFAVALTHAGREREAEPFFKKWQQLQPKDKGLLLNLAWCSMRTNNFSAAHAACQQLLQLEPHHPIALDWGALAASRLHLDEEAWHLWQVLSQVQPDQPNTYKNLGAIGQRLGLSEQSYAYYQAALALDPNYIDAQWEAAYVLHFLGLKSVEENFKTYLHLGRHMSTGIQPYQIWHGAASAKRKPLRLGFVTPDLHEHPVGFFLASVLEHLSPEEATCYAYSDDTTENLSTWTQGLRGHFQRFCATVDWSDAQVAAQIHQDEIDVLFDLNGWTQGGRLGVFAHKPAPVQLAWLGYFASTGLPAMDGIIADPYSVPESEGHLYIEKVWRLPHTRLAYTVDREVQKFPATPAPAKEKGFLTFGCFQNLNKITTAVLQVWGEIARQVPNARWYIQSPRLFYATSRTDLIKRLAAVGIDPEKIQLMGRQVFGDYLKSYAKVDMLLDTFPYPGGTTTLEALWMGVPTLTLATPGMLGRQGQALLTAAGMDAEWICHDTDTYVARAVQWAQESEWGKLAALRASLREQVRNSPVFDTQQFAQDWLALVREIWADACLSRPR